MSAELRKISQSAPPLDPENAKDELRKLVTALYRDNYFMPAAAISRYLLEGGTLDQAFGLTEPKNSKRGPQPKRELMLARAVQNVSIIPKESRPTMREIAALHGVSVRQVQLAHRKHKKRVERESDQHIADELIKSLNAYDAMTPEQQKQRDRELDALIEHIQSLIEYEKSLSSMRKELTHKRSNKPRSS